MNNEPKGGNACVYKSSAQKREITSMRLNCEWERRKKKYSRFVFVPLRFDTTMCEQDYVMMLSST